jgi:hypothetical protein
MVYDHLLLRLICKIVAEQDGGGYSSGPPTLYNLTSITCRLEFLHHWISAFSGCSLPFQTAPNA